jgi:hypothetical protein
VAKSASREFATHVSFNGPPEWCIMNVPNSDCNYDFSAAVFCDEEFRCFPLLGGSDLVGHRFSRAAAGEGPLHAQQRSSRSNNPRSRSPLDVQKAQQALQLFAQGKYAEGNNRSTKGFG